MLGVHIRHYTVTVSTYSKTDLALKNLRIISCRRFFEFLNFDEAKAQSALCINHISSISISIPLSLFFTPPLTLSPPHILALTHSLFFFYLFLFFHRGLNFRLWWSDMNKLFPVGRSMSLPLYLSLYLSLTISLSHTPSITLTFPLSLYHSLSPTLTPSITLTSHLSLFLVFLFPCHFFYCKLIYEGLRQIIYV